MPKWVDDDLEDLNVDAIATRVAGDVVARHRAVPYRGLAITGPIVGPKALEAVAKVSGIRVAVVTAMQQYDASVPRQILSAVRSEAATDSAWIAKQIEKRRSYRAAIARRLNVSSATAAAWDRDEAVVHITSVGH